MSTVHFYLVAILLTSYANPRACITTKVIDAEHYDVYWTAALKDKLRVGTLLATHDISC
jgi:hypothetical protein